MNPNPRLLTFGGFSKGKYLVKKLGFFFSPPGPLFSGKKPPGKGGFFFFLWGVLKNKKSQALKAKKDSCYELQRESRHRRAAEHVKPTRRVARDRVRHRLADWRAKLEPLVQPLAEFLDSRAWGLPLDLDEVSIRGRRPGVGSSPACM